MGRIKDYHIWHHNTYGVEPEGSGLPHVEEYLLSLRARFKIRLGQVLSKGFCEHDGCETKRIQLI